MFAILLLRTLKKPNPKPTKQTIKNPTNKQNKQNHHPRLPVYCTLNCRENIFLLCTST